MSNCRNWARDRWYLGEKAFIIHNTQQIVSFLIKHLKCCQDLSTWRTYPPPPPPSLPWRKKKDRTRVPDWCSWVIPGEISDVICKQVTSGFLPSLLSNLVYTFLPRSTAVKILFSFHSLINTFCQSRIVLSELIS